MSGGSQIFFWAATPACWTVGGLQLSRHGKVEVPPNSSKSLGGSRWPDPSVCICNKYIFGHIENVKLRFYYNTVQAADSKIRNLKVSTSGWKVTNM